jgi:transcription antitermination protein NusB
MGSRTRPRPARGQGARRRARELALAALYRGDLLGLGAADVVESLPETLVLHLEGWPPEDRASAELREETLAYATRLVAGVARSREQADEAISALSTDWPLDRLAATDRAILRMALWELGEATAAPAVIINEAVELARAFGGADSPRFVNGILGAWVRREGAGTAGDAGGATAADET